MSSRLHEIVPIGALFEVSFVCSYTSVGDKLNTIPNPTLKRLNPVTGEEEYAHADQLVDMDHLERAGRIQSAK